MYVSAAKRAVRARKEYAETAAALDRVRSLIVCEGRRRHHVGVTELLAALDGTLSTPGQTDPGAGKE